MITRPTFLFAPKHGIADSMALRILPIGDSITYGTGSSTGNGYRLDLLMSLPSNHVEYIGTQIGGTMKNPQNEGYPGAIIDEIANASKPALAGHPNLVLLLAGVNDINRETDIPGAPRRLAALVEQIFAACPETVVLVAELTPFPDRQQEIDDFNAGMALYIDEMIAWDKHVVRVKMDLTKDQSTDGLHPNDAGYARMAECWLKGIESAEKKKWFVKPDNI